METSLDVYWWLKPFFKKIIIFVCNIMYMSFKNKKFIILNLNPTSQVMSKTKRKKLQSISYAS